MGCPKNIKTFWFFRWEGCHDWRDIYANSGPMWWEIGKKCEICGSHRTVNFLEDEDMIRRGYDVANVPYKLLGWYRIEDGQLK